MVWKFVAPLVGMNRELTRGGLPETVDGVFVPVLQVVEALEGATDGRAGVAG